MHGSELASSKINTHMIDAESTRDFLGAFTIFRGEISQYAMKKLIVSTRTPWRLSRQQHLQSLR